MKNLFILLVFLLFTNPIAGKPKTKKVDFKKLDKFFEQIVTEWNVPGMSVGIVKDGKVIFSKGYGTKEIGKNKKPDGNTLYAIASNSKAFTSAIIAMLVQEGKLNWDDKVKDHLPYFEIYEPIISQQVTIKDLLCHRVGLKTFSGDFIWFKSDLKAKEIIERIKYLPKSFDFRAGYGYSNLMYITAGEVIRSATGNSWSKIVQERILIPLAMNRTITSTHKLSSKKNFATPHAFTNDNNIPIEWEDWEEVGALGGIISSVNDISKWMIFNMDHGINGQDTLLSKISRNIMWTPHNNFVIDHTKDNDYKRHFSGYGLGWGLSDYHGKMQVGHTGGYDGMISAVNMIPEEKLGVVVLTNGLKSPIMAVTYHVFDVFLGNDEKDWSAIYLKRRAEREKKDTRIADIKKKRIENTSPSFPLEKYVGSYKADMYGDIDIFLENDQLKIKFKHSPDLNAILRHWHYDVWEIKWEKLQAWFDFGTVKFIMDNNMEITGLSFDVPNDDILFDELKPVKGKNE